MSRPPFDPTRAAGPEDAGELFAAARAEASPLTVTEVAGLIRTALEDGLPAPLRVVGQVGSLTRRRHWYFSLRDEQSVVRCVAWATSARGFGFVPQEGDEVVATGHVSHYGPQGSTQLYVRRLEPVGAGALELRFRALCAELRALGYFDPARKKALPLLPRRIAVITSRTGAAIHDVIDTAARRCRAVGLVLVDCRVQGDGAAEQIARAVRFVDAGRDALGVDAVLVTRGGGSVEDLWAFNERVVADAVHACRLPVVAAIGHESDTTVIELVADVRAATPTQAVMRLVPEAAELGRQLDHHGHRLRLLLARTVENGRRRVEAAGRFRLFRDPAAPLREARQRLAALQAKLEGALRRRADRRAPLRALSRRLARAAALHVARSRGRLEALGRHLEGVGPQRVLARGYSYTTTADGRLVTSVRDVAPRSEVVTRVRDGAIRSVVERTEPARDDPGDDAVDDAERRR